MRRLLLVTLALSVSGCFCSGPATGECSGTWGGVTFEKVKTDPESRVIITRSSSCTVQDLKTYQLSWGEKKLNATFSFRSGGPSILSPVDYTVPPPTTTFESFSVTPDVASATGTLHLTIIGIQGRRAGSLTLTAGAESLSCDFEVPYVTEGTGPSCGGSGDADYD